MNRTVKFTSLTAFLFFMALMIGSFHAMASDTIKFDVITVVGEVNNSNQIIVDGDIYEVDDTTEGDDLVKNYIGRKVRVTGKLRIEGDMRILDVTAFEVVGE